MKEYDELMVLAAQSECRPPLFLLFWRLRGRCKAAAKRKHPLPIFG